MRTRALIDGVDFPYFGSIKHEDVYYWARYKLRLNSNRLETVCRTLFGETEKTHLEFKYWADATRGGVKALDWILDHNKRDVRDLERVYDVLVNYARRKDTSL
jgi:uncharacterized protein YprB with RNaseH-like and TPR domain